MEKNYTGKCKILEYIEQRYVVLFFVGKVTLSQYEKSDYSVCNVVARDCFKKSESFFIHTHTQNSSCSVISVCLTCGKPWVLAPLTHRDRQTDRNGGGTHEWHDLTAVRPSKQGVKPESQKENVDAFCCIGVKVVPYG